MPYGMGSKGVQSCISNMTVPLHKDFHRALCEFSLDLKLLNWILESSARTHWQHYGGALLRVLAVEGSAPAFVQRNFRLSLLWNLLQSTFYVSDHGVRWWPATMPESDSSVNVSILCCRPSVTVSILCCRPWHYYTDARSQAQYYRQRVSFYKLFDGREGRRNWRNDLCECLSEWQVQFPEVVRKGKSVLDASLAQEPSSEPGGGEPVPEEWV